MNRLLSNAIWDIVCLIGIFILWQAASIAIGIEAFPTATQALVEVPKLLTSASDLADMWASLRRMLTGFVAACVIGIPIGLIMGRSQVVADVLNPVLMLIYPVPKAALTPLLMLWVGTGDFSKILVIVLGASVPLIYHSYQGGRDVAKNLIWSARAMGMSPPARLFRIVLPAAMPEILSGMRVGITMSLIVMVSSEIIGRQAGVGNILFNSLDMAIYPPVYGMIIIIGMIGFAVDLLFQQFQRSVVPWALPRKTGDDDATFMWS